MAIPKYQKDSQNCKAAETLELWDSIAECFYVKSMMKDILKIGDDQLLPIVCCMDNWSLYNIYSAKIVTAEYLLIDIPIIRL